LVVERAKDVGVNDDSSTMFHMEIDRENDRSEQLKPDARY
jgi:hypothetical protein